MHILLVADGRSIITLRWLEGLLSLGYRVSMVSTFPCEKPNGITHFLVLPLAFSKMAGGQVALQKSDANKIHFKRTLNTLRGFLLSLRYALGPLTIPVYARRYQRFVEQVQPQVVHALRIPFEGMLASATPQTVPLVISIWGNDLTLHAHGSALMSSWTKRTLQRAQGLMADTQRDVQLAKEWGLAEAAPSLVVPGNGGVHLAALQEQRQAGKKSTINLPADRQFVINPRGFRPGSVHQETFFKAIPLILKKQTKTHFLCPAMLGQPQAERWLRDLQIENHITLLPYLPQVQLWELYLRSQVYVSLSSHDGTPNTFLEAIACGCYPVVGDIASLREWVNADQNGALVDPLDVSATAQAILLALQDAPLRQKAAAYNAKLIREQAEVGVVRKKTADFYQQFS